MPGDDRRDYTDLKEYIRETLGTELARLTRAFEEQSRVLKDIELKTTTRTAELQKDVNNLYEEINTVKKSVHDLRTVLDQEESTRQFMHNENRQAISNLKNEQMAKWETQITINEGIKQLRSVMWLILTVVVGLLGTAIWQMIVGGGAGALIK